MMIERKSSLFFELFFLPDLEVVRGWEPFDQPWVCTAN